MSRRLIQFPRDFLFGAATAAYQIEGAWNHEGKGESIWDRFSHTPGKILTGETGDVACDHYYRFAQDVALMKQLGLKAYRFSISWPRVMPEGKAGSVNQRGLDFYSRLVDELLKNGIEPWVTLYHWDLPQVLQDEGGFANRDTTDHFAAYAALVSGVLGDRVKRWMTINEPWVAAFLGNKTGEHAPGIKDEKTSLQVAHGLLLGHGKAMQAVRSQVSDAQVGIVLSLSPCEPEHQDARHYIASEKQWQQDAQWFLHPLLRGCYPEALFYQFGKHAPEVCEGDMEIISRPMDLLGVNYYFRTLVGLDGVVKQIPEATYTQMGWEVHAKSLRGLLCRLTYDYRNLPPLYITENGAAFADTLTGEGRVHDGQRLNYIKDHLQQAHLAMEQGVNLKGYFCWSLLDNFEWAFGTSKRFGLIYNDYATQKRHIKDSGFWYQQMIAAGGSFLADEPEAEPALPEINFEPARPTYVLKVESPKASSPTSGFEP